MTARQLTLLQDLKPDILTCAPSYAIRLGEAVAEAGMKPGDIGLKAGVFGAEWWSRCGHVSRTSSACARSISTDCPR